MVVGAQQGEDEKLMITIKGVPTPKPLTFELELEKLGDAVYLCCTVTGTDLPNRADENFKWSLGDFREENGRLMFSRDTGLSDSLFKLAKGTTGI